MKMKMSYTQKSYWALGVGPTSSMGAVPLRSAQMMGQKKKKKKKMKMKMSYTHTNLTGLQISSCRRHWQALPLSRRAATSFTRTTISHSSVTRDPHSSVFYTSQKRMHRYMKIIISKWLGKVLIYSPSTDLLRPMQSHSDTHKQVLTKLFLQLY